MHLQNKYKFSNPDLAFHIQKKSLTLDLNFVNDVCLYDKNYFPEMLSQNYIVNDQRLYLRSTTVLSNNIKIKTSTRTMMSPSGGNPKLPNSLPGSPSKPLDNAKTTGTTISSTPISFVNITKADDSNSIYDSTHTPLPEKTFTALPQEPSMH